MITIALPKGRLTNMKLLKKIGLDVSEIEQDTRKLIFYDEKNDVRFIMVKPTDVPVYVDHGVADIGIAGKDTLIEAGTALGNEMLDLSMENAASASRATGTKSATPLLRECCGWLQNIHALQRGITTARAKILRLSSSTEALSLRRCWDCRM